MPGQRNTLHATLETVALEIESNRNNMNTEPNIYPSNRTNVSATPNTQGYINSTNTTKFLLGNAARRGGSFYVHDRVMSGAGNAEHGSAQICITEDKVASGWNLVSIMTPALRLNVGQLIDTNGHPSEAERAPPLSGNGICSSINYICGRTNHVNI